MSNEVQIPEGILSNLYDPIVRNVIFSQKSRIKDAVITIVDQTHNYTVEWVNENWDAIFDKLAQWLKLTAVPEEFNRGGEQVFDCDFDPANAEFVPESGAESVVGIANFILWLAPYIIAIFKKS